MKKVDYSSLTDKDKAEVTQAKLVKSERAITDLRQVEELKKELIDSGFIEGQDFQVDNHEILTKTKSNEFKIKDDSWCVHEYSYNYYAGEIKLLWKDASKTYKSSLDQSHITTENPNGWYIDNESERLSLATRSYYSSNSGYHGKYGEYITPLTIYCSGFFCKNTRDLRATTYLKRMRECTANAPVIIAENLDMEKKFRNKQDKIVNAEKVLSSPLLDLLGRKVKVRFDDYDYELTIFFPEGDSNYRGDDVTIKYNPDSYECSIYKVTNDYGFIPWSELYLIQEVHEEIVA